MGVWLGADKRSKFTTPAQMLADDDASVAAVANATSLLSLQNNVLEHILLKLHLTDLARCCQVCKGLRSIVQQEDIWQLLCTNSFPSLTCIELKQWLHLKGFPVVARPPQQSPNTSAAQSRQNDHITTYRYEAVAYDMLCEPQRFHRQVATPCRGLYRVLKHLEPLVGVWKCENASAKPALYIFSWGAGHMHSRKLSYDVPGQEPFVDPFYQIGPGHSSNVQHVDKTHCLLTVQTEGCRSPITKAVQAATAVAVGGIAIPRKVLPMHILCYMRSE